MSGFKPAGYNSISPYLIVNGAQRMADLLRTVFGARELRRFDHANGTVMHMEMMVDDSVLMISDATDQYPANKLLLHIYVPDVDAVFKKAIEAGCKSLEEPKTREGDPDKRGMFEDFSGNVWAVGTQQ